jgi:hypothetical protein
VIPLWETVWVNAVLPPGSWILNATRKDHIVAVGRTPTWTKQVPPPAVATAAENPFNGTTHPTRLLIEAALMVKSDAPLLVNVNVRRFNFPTSEPRMMVVPASVQA